MAEQEKPKKKEQPVKVEKKKKAPSLRLMRGRFKKGFEQKHKGGARVRVQVIKIGSDKVCLKWGIETTITTPKPANKSVGKKDTK
jgi:hypothetical protein